MGIFSKILSSSGSDKLATILGFVAGFAQLHGFSISGVITGNPDDVFKLGGAIALILLGLITNKFPTLSEKKLRELEGDDEGDPLFPSYEPVDPEEKKYLAKVHARVEKHLLEETNRLKGAKVARKEKELE